MKKVSRFLLPLCALAFILSAGQIPDKTINWYSLKEAQELAQSHNKKVLIFAEASWCKYCKKMHREVFPDQEVIKKMNTYYYPVKLDVESDKEIEFNGKKMKEKEFAYMYRVTGTPTIFFVDPEGKILGAQPGFIAADMFKQLLTYVGTDAFSQLSFKDYIKQETKGE